MDLKESNMKIKETYIYFKSAYQVTISDLISVWVKG